MTKTLTGVSAALYAALCSGAFAAGLPEAKRRTWTIAGPKKGSALRDSGLIGPVRLIRCRFAEIPRP